MFTVGNNSPLHAEQDLPVLKCFENYRARVKSSWRANLYRDSLGD